MGGGLSWEKQIGAGRRGCDGAMVRDRCDRCGGWCDGAIDAAVGTTVGSVGSVRRGGSAHLFPVLLSS